MLGGPSTNLTAMRGRREGWEFWELAGISCECEVDSAVWSPSFPAPPLPPALHLFYILSLGSHLDPITFSYSLSALSNCPVWFLLERAVPPITIHSVHRDSDLIVLGIYLACTILKGSGYHSRARAGMRVEVGSDMGLDWGFRWSMAQGGSDWQFQFK